MSSSLLYYTYVPSKAVSVYILLLCTFLYTMTYWRIIIHYVRTPGNRGLIRLADVFTAHYIAAVPRDVTITGCYRTAVHINTINIRTGLGVTARPLHADRRWYNNNYCSTFDRSKSARPPRGPALVVLVTFTTRISACRGCIIIYHFGTNAYVIAMRLIMRPLRGHARKHNTRRHGKSALLLFILF